MSAPLTHRQINQYLATLLPQRHPEIVEMERIAAEGHFPIIGPSVGVFCYLVARMTGAKRIFELGSGYGYSTAWFAMALRDNGGGEVHHTVWEESLSRQARGHLEKMGLDRFVRFHVSEAVTALRTAGDGFDIIFNDIDKEGYPDSLPVIESALREGGVLIIDNMLWGGDVLDGGNGEPATVGILEFTRRISTSPLWVSSLVPIRDGIILAMKTPSGVLSSTLWSSEGL